MQFLDNDPHALNHHAQEEEDYDRVLEDINASLRKSRGGNKEDKKIHREPSKGTLDSRKSESRDVIRRSGSRTAMDQIPVINPPPKSPSRQHLDTRYPKLISSYHSSKKKKKFKVSI